MMQITFSVFKAKERGVPFFGESPDVEILAVAAKVISISAMRPIAAIIPTTIKYGLGFTFIWIVLFGSEPEININGRIWQIGRNCIS